MPQINKPNSYFNTKLYTGNGTTDTAITGVGFQPDMTWIKSRSAATSHSLTDAVRGNTKGLYPDLTNAENTSSNYIKSFDSDGFTLGTDSIINANSATFASWNWLASNTTSSNTDGSITSTVSASTTSGFSIVSYTGTGANSTVGHGLGSAPKMIIFKERNGTRNWRVYHEKMGNAKVMYLNGTDAEVSDSTAFNSTSPTSSVFSVGTSGGTNASSNTYIAYCFADVKGFSKFGSYVGNGNADGTFIYTGFKPAFVIIKVSSTTNDWSMYDNQRDPINQVDNYLQPNTSSAEVSDTGKGTDFLSNGFKLRTTHGTHNTSGATYIYMAFASEPLVGSNNVPATAR